MIPVRDLLTGRQVVTLEGHATALEAARAMAANKVGCILIVDKAQHPLGVFTERDLMTRVIVGGKDPNRVRLEEVMTTDLFLVEAERTVREVRSEMQERHIRHLPVIEEGRVIAMLSLRDLLRADLREQKNNVDAMTSYIQGDALTEAARGLADEDA